LIQASSYSLDLVAASGFTARVKLQLGCPAKSGFVSIPLLGLNFLKLLSDLILAVALSFLVSCIHFAVAIVNC
jgi:hypothetical protein